MLRPTVLVALSVLAAPLAAAAQATPSAAILTASPADASLAPFCAAVDRVERARLDGLGAVHMSSAPALSMADLQLAVGCVGENDACFRAIASQLGVDILFYATVDKAGDTRIVTLHSFDARGAGTAHQAQRQGPEADVVEQVDPMLRELLGLPPAPVVEAHVDEHAHHDDTPPPPPRDDTMLIVSLASFGGALVAGVIGGIVGALELGSADDYAHVNVHDMASADAANAAYGRASDQATIANVMFVVAGVAAAAGATFLVLHLTGGSAHADARPTVSLVPTGPGLALRGTF